MVLVRRPLLSLEFAPAELLKFDMPSVLVGKKEEARLVLPARAGTQVATATWKNSRWVFQWANEDATRTHQASYTLHPKGCEITVTVQLYDDKPSIQAKLRL